jgi:hypothetical protein
MNKLNATVMLALVALSVLGCGQSSSDRVEVFPVEGRILLNGQPLAGAQVVFHPQGSKTLPASAKTDAQGNYKLSTYDQHDGAAEGAYAVTVHYFPVVRWDDGFLPGANVLPPKYSVPQATDLRVQVARGENRLNPLELKR